MNIMEFIKEAGITPDKSRDQFFLIDSYILDYEAGLLKLAGKDVVLEIGAGFGSLTVRLAQKCKVLAAEIDPKLCDFLRRIKNTVAMNNDIIRILEEARRDSRLGTFNKVIGNIPYSISQDILLELLKHPWSVAVLCVQKEFADKLQDKKEKLHHLAADCCDIRAVMAVPKEKFYPEAVDSVVVTLKQKKTMDEEYWKFLQKLFRARNRNIRNVFPGAPAKLRARKAVQLEEKEIRQVYEAIKAGYLKS